MKCGHVGKQGHDVRIALAASTGHLAQMFYFTGNLALLRINTRDTFNEYRSNILHRYLIDLQ